MKTFLRIMLVLVCVSLAAFVISIRLQNPDMSETRLFLTYWKGLVSHTALVIVFAYLDKMERNL